MVIDRANLPPEAYSDYASATRNYEENLSSLKLPKGRDAGPDLSHAARAVEVFGVEMKVPWLTKLMGLFQGARFGKVDRPGAFVKLRSPLFLASTGPLQKTEAALEKVRAATSQLGDLPSDLQVREIEKGQAISHLLEEVNVRKKMVEEVIGTMNQYLRG